MDSILSFFQLAFRLLKTNARKTDSILSLGHLERLSQAIPQFLGLPASKPVGTLCPSPGSLWDQQGMGQCRRSSPSPGSLWDERGMGHQEVEEIYTGFLEDTGAMRTKKTTWFWPTDVHSICVTVRLPPHFPFRATLCGSAEGSGGTRTDLLHIM